MKQETTISHNDRQRSSSNAGATSATSSSPSINGAFLVIRSRNTISVQVKRENLRFIIQEALDILSEDPHLTDENNEDSWSNLYHQ
jgi:hypothetical protein